MAMQTKMARDPSVVLNSGSAQEHWIPGVEMTKGILAFGAYIPWRRLQRKAIADTHAWFDPGAQGPGQGRARLLQLGRGRVTMAVEAARDALAGRDRASITALRFASTTFPFLDRLHSGIVAGALSLDDGVSTIDIAATQRAGTSALIEALGGSGETLVVASEKRKAKAASPVEMSSGDGAAAILVGEGKPIARLLAKASRTADFVDHFRSVDNQFDYQWEERWIRDAGYMPIVPPTIKRCLEDAKVGGQGRHPLLHAGDAGARRQLGRQGGRHRRQGHMRAPARQLRRHRRRARRCCCWPPRSEKAKPGDKILVVGFGQGADALLFEVTPEIANRPKNRGVVGHLARRKEETSYGRYLAFNDLIELERGMRSETDKGTPLIGHVAQPRDGDELRRRQVLQVRHAAVPEDRHLRQSELQRHRHPGAARLRRHARAESSPIRPTG